jgi:mono/diheme cytochrome c family protein
MKGLASLAVLLLAGCDVSMTQQPKYVPYAPSSFWANGTSARPIPANTVAQGDLEREAAEKTPPAATPALLARGQERYNTYCTPCHGIAGDGDGIVVQRGFPPPPSYHIDRLRAADGQYFFDIQTRGFGVMYSYADRVPAAERWAIAAYIRALQVSRYATLAMAPEAREKLQ